MDKRRRYWIAYSFWCALLIALCYGSALHLPFMADDFFQFPFVDRHTLSEIWQTSEGLYYFRPLAFTVWKLFQVTFGGYPPAILHAFNLLVYWISGLLVGWLADRLWARLVDARNTLTDTGRWSADWGRRFVAATLFLLFPFNYEAVPWIAAVMHLLVTMLVLLAISSYVNLRRNWRLIWLLPTLLFVFLAPFSHELGVLTVVLILLIEITEPGRVVKLRKKGLILSLMMVLIILWWLIWRQSPATTGTGGLLPNNLRQLAHNSIYSAQSAAYPFSWLGVRVSSWTGISEILVAAALSVIVLGFAAWVQWRTRANRLAWLPWLWILVSSAPSVVFLSFPYFSAAPRVLMLPAVGIVWLWTDVGFRLPSLFPTTRRARRTGVALAATLMLLLLVQNLTYIRRQMQTYVMGGRLIDSVVEATTRANQDDLSAIFVNLPVWLAPPKSSYAIGEEGAMLMPALDNLEALVSVHTGRPAAIEAVVFHDTRADVPYHSGLLGNGPNWDERDARPALVFITQYDEDDILIQKVGQLAISRPTRKPLAVFGNAVSLLEASIAGTEEGIEIDLTWRKDDDVPPDVTVFVHVVDENGQLIAQGDGDPLGGTFPLSSWERGMVASDIRTIVTDQRNLSLHIGLYERISGERLSVFSADGTEFVDQYITLPTNLSWQQSPDR